MVFSLASCIQWPKRGSRLQPHLYSRFDAIRVFIEATDIHECMNFNAVVRHKNLKPNTLRWNPLSSLLSSSPRSHALSFHHSTAHRSGAACSSSKSHIPKWTNLLILTGFWQWFNWIETTPIEPKINFENQMDLNGTKPMKSNHRAHPIDNEFVCHRQSRCPPQSDVY